MYRTLIPFFVVSKYQLKNTNKETLQKMYLGVMCVTLLDPFLHAWHRSNQHVHTFARSHAHTLTRSRTHTFTLPPLLPLLLFLLVLPPIEAAVPNLFELSGDAVKAQ